MDLCGASPVVAETAARWVCLSLALLLVWTIPAAAIVAGVPPDSPAARVDANRPDSPFAGIGSISVRAADSDAVTGIYGGSLIAPRWVLTAGHVGEGLKAGRDTFNLNLNGDLSHRLAIRRVVLHPNFRSLPGGRHADDLALLELTAPAPAGAPIYPLATDALRPGTTVLLVGYGASGSGATGATIAGQAQIKRIAWNAIDRLESLPPLRGAQLYLFDFDGPLSSGFLGGPSLGNALEGTLAGGDSGGPALLRGSDGRWRIVGVNTFVFGVPGGPPPPLFGSGGGGVLIAPYAAWIAGTISGD